MLLINRYISYRENTEILLVRCYENKMEWKIDKSGNVSEEVQYLDKHQLNYLFIY